jgi:hypothetical protein
VEHEVLDKGSNSKNCLNLERILEKIHQHRFGLPSDDRDPFVSPRSVQSVPGYE